MSCHLLLRSWIVLYEQSPAPKFKLLTLRTERYSAAMKATEGAETLAVTFFQLQQILQP